jgi:hypothetical protein
VTNAAGVEELHARVRDAVRCHFEGHAALTLISLHVV